MRVKPGARVPGVSRAGDTVVVAVRERAEGGRANAGVVAAVAAWLDVPPSHVRIERGAGARLKRLAIAALSEASLASAVEDLTREHSEL